MCCILQLKQKSASDSSCMEFFIFFDNLHKLGTTSQFVLRISRHFVARHMWHSSNDINTLWNTEFKSICIAQRVIILNMIDLLRDIPIEILNIIAN